jgi:hypothetical protein
VYRTALKKVLYIRLEAFTATELDKIFLGNKPCQLRGKMMEVEMIFEMLGFYPQVTQPVAREDVIEKLHSVVKMSDLYTDTSEYL